MIVRVVMCDRCGNEITEAHPDRISIHQQYCEEVTDGWGGRKVLSKYKVAKNIHLCTECTRLFKAFLDNKY